MNPRGFQLVSVYLFLLLAFPDVVVMTRAQILLDDRGDDQYGEPTIFYIKKVKNQTESSKTKSQESGPWAPVGVFEPYYRLEFTVIILLALITIIIFTILGNTLVVAAVFLERSLHVRNLIWIFNFILKADHFLTLSLSRAVSLCRSLTLSDHKSYSKIKLKIMNFHLSWETFSWNNWDIFRNEMQKKRFKKRHKFF